MEIMKCVNGHSYDPSVTPECPECARLRAQGTVPLEDGRQDMYDKTEPVIRRTEPVKRMEPARNTNGPAEDYEKTMPVDYRKKMKKEEDKKPEGREAENSVPEEIRPVTGWLVCVEGASKGKDYAIHAEYNYIGRSTAMDICIQGDQTISRENHAIIAYDTQERMFYFAPSGGGSIVRVNGKAVLSNVELQAYDRLTIGKSEFLFLPFCGEKFEWTE